MKMEDFEALFKEIASYLWMICLGVMGGTVNYVSRIRRDSKLKFSIIELLGEWFASGFVALMTAYACLYLEFNFPLTAVMCGISGHLAGRIVYMLDTHGQRLLETAIKKITK